MQRSGNYPAQYPTLQGGGNDKRNLLGRRTEKAVKEARHEEMRLSRISELGNYQSLTQ